jgi:hypothetical protein
MLIKTVIKVFSQRYIVVILQLMMLSTNYFKGFITNVLHDQVFICNIIPC